LVAKLSRLYFLDILIFIMSNTNLLASLEAISLKRKGGVFNIRGINYQVLYSIDKLLHEFISDNGKNKLFQLEGVEDLDFYTPLEKSSTGEFIQLKRKNESIETDDFVKDILSNLLEVYDVNRESSFLIVSNFYPKGKLQDLVSANKGGKQLSANNYKYWHDKIQNLRKSYSEQTINHFLSKINFIRKVEEDLVKGSLSTLITHYNIVNGNELRFFDALYFHIQTWSIEKKIVTKQDIDSIIQKVSDDISRGVVNHAIRGGWIELIDFDNKGDIISENGYFDGKAAKPIHIAANLPVERPIWENEILDSINNFDVTLIKASSGQGKSTLAWRVAFTLSKQGYSIYELTEIGENLVQDVYLFIESRLVTGIKPIIVIDGLSDALKDWLKLAKKVQILRGVKLLITSREEDWFRYGNGASQLNLKPINITLEEKEAVSIYSIFQKKKKIHGNVSDWRVAWAKVQQNKLLIEYVYLITRGQMIHERMIDQLNTFQNDKHEYSKKGILRLVSVADILNIKLQTTSLLDFVNVKMKFNGDEATLLQSLKNEYHLQIEDREYIEGLHPVRSKHIADILHETLPISSTLIDLLSVIEPQNLTTFLSQAPLMIHSESSKNAFLEKLASVISEKSYEEIVNSIIGIFSSDAHIHWLENKEIYDKVANQGLLLYLSAKVPFNPLPKTHFDFINDYNPMFQQNLDSISDPDMSKSNTILFITSLKKSLDEKPLKEKLKKITYLERWYQRFNLESKLLTTISITNIERYFNTAPVEDLGEIIYVIYLLKPSVYLPFYERNLSKLISKLKIETDTITIEFQEGSLKIRYIVNTQKDINDQSVSRIKTIGYCVPHVENFDVEGIFFPNPFLKNLYSKIGGLKKHGDWKGWLQFDNFITEGNRIWIERIESYYEFETQYEWQKYWVDFRIKIVEWLRQTSRLMETRMSKMAQFDSEIKKYDTLVKVLLNYKKQGRMLRYDENFRKEEVKNDVSIFDKWKSPLENVLNQTFPDAKNEHGWHIYKLNIKNTLNNLPTMQEAFDSICIKTAQYFDTTDLKKQELTTYSYFADLVEFFYDEFHLKNRLVNSPRSEVNVWKNDKLEDIMQEIYEVKVEFELLNIYELLLPKSILVESDYLDSVVLGIRDITVQDFQNDLPYIFEGLKGLSNVKAHFFYLILIDNYNEANKMCFRFSDTFLEEMKSIIAGEKLNFENQLFPVEVSEKIINQLEGIVITENTNENPVKSAIFLLHEVLWRYSEIKKRVPQNDIDVFSWLTKLLNELEKFIHNYLNQLRVETLFYKKYEEIVKQVFAGNLDFDESLCIKYWEEDFVKIH
jgi:hypothetical protein